MRWLFVLLLVLNGFYFVWSQLEAPVRPKEIAALSALAQPGKDIKLLSERATAPAAAGEQCLYLGGFAGRDALDVLQARLQAAQVNARVARTSAGGASLWWLRIPPQSRDVIDDRAFADLSKDINNLKRTIIACEGVATLE